MTCRQSVHAAPTRAHAYAVAPTNGSGACLASGIREDSSTSTRVQVRRAGAYFSTVHVFVACSTRRLHRHQYVHDVDLPCMQPEKKRKKSLWTECGTARALFELSRETAYCTPHAHTTRSCRFGQSEHVLSAEPTSLERLSV